MLWNAVDDWKMSPSEICWANSRGAWTMNGSGSIA
jgi:hypothetical protein